METQIYLWVGRFAVWLCFGYLTFKFVGWIIELFINWLSTKFSIMWRVFEYFFYRVEFREWVKDKDRHPKVK